MTDNGKEEVHPLIELANDNYPNNRRQKPRRADDPSLEKIISLTEAAVASTASAEVLRAEVGELATVTNKRIVQLQHERRRSFLILCLLVLIAGLAALSSVLNNRALKEIQDCTQPEGQCYRDNSKRSADVVSSITDGDQNGVDDTVEIKEKLDELLVKGTAQ